MNRLDFNFQLGVVYEMQGNVSLAQHTYIQVLQASEDDKLRQVVSKRLLSLESRGRFAPRPLSCGTPLALSGKLDDYSCDKNQRSQVDSSHPDCTAHIVLCPRRRSTLSWQYRLPEQKLACH